MPDGGHASHANIVNMIAILSASCSHRSVTSEVASVVAGGRALVADGRALAVALICGALVGDEK